MERVCSHYSLLEGVDSPERLIERAVAAGHEVLALTDVNNLYGAVSFVEAARRHGIRPILGCQLRDSVHGQQAAVLIAEPSGYVSLCRILSRLHLRERPVLLDLLSENAEGLQVLVDRTDLLLPLRERFGKRLWLEIVRPTLHPDRPVSAERELLEAAQRLGVPVVAGGAVHFAEPQGYAVHRLLTAVRHGMLLDQLPPRLPITSEHYLTDAETRRQRFRDLPAALVNLRRLAEQCRSDVLPRGVTLPPAKVPRGWTAFGFLRALCQRGLRRIAEADALHHSADQATYQRRLEEELHLVQLRDLADYFLVVRDIALYARRRGLSMALRGSAGNSLICFLLGITDVDPLRFGLPLERFLHAGRPDLPDIDLDFDWRVRDQVIAWVFRRYGAEHTAMISSHLFFRPALAFREAAKVHGLSNEQISHLLEEWERRIAPETTLEAEGVGLPGSTPPRGFPLEAERWPRLLEDTRRLLGKPHHLSIHPGGVVITPRPIEDYVPLQRAAKGVIITQFDKDPIEQIGLVKIDLLGNRALSTVDEARRILAECQAVAPTDIRLLPSLGTERDEITPRVVDLLRRGDTLGVNQLESPAMRHLLVQMQPRGLDDVIQALALIRPGAASIGAKERFIRRRRGLEPTVFDHPFLQPLLADTHGLMLYEDDALAVVQTLTGLSPSEADHFRKRVTKTRDPEEAAALSRAFLEACRRHGVDQQSAAQVWVQLAKFNSYSFCKSHAVSYGLIAWQAARLKVMHPAAFWCAALNNNEGMYPRRVYIEAIKRAGIPVRLPCVNRSQRIFSVEPRDAEAKAVGHGDAAAIRTGLGLIHGLEEAVIEAILEDRRRRGPFADLEDFCRRVAIGPEALSLLIQAGAFDFTGRKRPEMFLELEMLASGGRQLPRHRAAHAARSPHDIDLASGGRQPSGAASGGRQPSGLPFPAWIPWSPNDYTPLRRWQGEWHCLGFLTGPHLMALLRPRLPK
ncbi:MAG: DNA polymerase III subunit alpha, partial [Gemmatales bacterium]|nr:DNA polymerase III subunit alpha [Gemmatales bacterium]MDW8385974.1 DNA polymerase III subunit alpha [Gemmatales bacterium]